MRMKKEERENGGRGEGGGDRKDREWARMKKGMKRGEGGE